MLAADSPCAHPADRCEGRPANLQARGEPCSRGESPAGEGRPAALQARGEPCKARGEPCKARGESRRRRETSGRGRWLPSPARRALQARAGRWLRALQGTPSHRLIICVRHRPLCAHACLTACVGPVRSRPVCRLRNGNDAPSPPPPSAPSLWCPLVCALLWVPFLTRPPSHDGNGAPHSARRPEP